MIINQDKGEKSNETLYEKEKPGKNIEKKSKLRPRNVTGKFTGCCKTKVIVKYTLALEGNLN